MWTCARRGLKEKKSENLESFGVVDCNVDPRVELLAVLSFLSPSLSAGYDVDGFFFSTWIQ